MDAVEFLKELKRMCEEHDNCDGCPYDFDCSEIVYCYEWALENQEKAVTIVEKWSKEHPRKTILQDFLEKYPKAILLQTGFHTGVPHGVCPYMLGYDDNHECIYERSERRDCIDCWNRLMGVE